jgi:hypothetical protein
MDMLLVLVLALVLVVLAGTWCPVDTVVLLDTLQPQRAVAILTPSLPPSLRIPSC